MPQLKIALASKAEVDALPEALRGLYIEKDGKFVLDADVEDVGGLKSALGKERTSRETLEKTLADLRKALGDADPVKAREAYDTLLKLDDGKLLSEGKHEEWLTARTKRMREDFEGKLKETGDKLTTAEKRLAELVIDNELRAVASTKKVRDTAVDDFLERGRKVYKLVDGKAVPHKADGTVEYGKDGKAMSMAEWADGIVTAAPHLFEGSSGGGAQNGGAGGRGGGAHTITREQARDRTAYKAASDAAAKAGAQLQVVD